MDNPQKGEYYNWHTEDSFTPVSVRATDYGLVTNKVDTPTDALDSVLIELKTPKASNDVLETEIKDLLKNMLDNPSVTLSIMNERSALIQANINLVSQVKKICDESSLPNQGATIIII